MSHKIPSAQRDNISQLLAPNNGYRGTLQKKGIQPKNHMKDNLRDLRLEQERNRSQRDIDNVDEKPLYKLPQFQEVESRLYEPSQRYIYRRNSLNNPNENEEPQGVYLTRGTSDKRRQEIDKKNKEVREDVERKIQQEIKNKQIHEEKLIKKNSSSNLLISSSINSRKDPVPLKQERGIIHHQDNNFLHENKYSIKKNATSSATAAALGSFNSGNETGFHEEFGRVPQYINERKLEWEKDRQRKEQEKKDLNCPQGMRLMDEEERLETLDILEKKKQDLLDEMNRLPFHCETLSQKRRSQHLEDKMREIDTALSLFRKPKVYVAK